ncbi:MAG TPA: universal stress protein [Gammaproteobacteria bacterium]
MALKELLLHLDGGTLDTEHLKLTIELAQAHDAALTGLFVEHHVADGLILDAPPSGALIDALEEERQNRRANIASRFDEVTKKAGIRCELRIEDGDTVHWLGLHGRYADLIITGQPQADDDLLGTGGVPGAVALSGGRPVLVIPRAGARTLVAKRTVVAWNESREATRAISDAMPILQMAERVEVLNVSSGAHASAGESSVATMSRHLTRHGVKAEANVMSQGEVDPAELLLSHVNRYGADLVVMGAYGHSRLREFVLGGMTRHLLNYSPVPLFLSH